MDRRPSYPVVLLAVLALAVAATGVYGVATSTAAFGAYNPAWDGASELRSQAGAVGAEPTMVIEPADYGDLPPDGTVAVVLSPDEPYAPDDAARVRSFVRDGGTLLVAEDFGPHSNALLEDVGANATVDGRILRDKRFNHRNQSLPVAGNVTPHPLTSGVDALTFNHGTAVVPNGARPLVTSSAFAYLDANRNGALDGGETLGPRPVVTVEAVGEGTVIVAGDPSVLINAMVDRPGNRAFARNAFSGHDVVAMDYSHAEPVPPLQIALALVRRIPALQAALGVLAVLAVLLVGRGLPRSRGADEPEPEAADRLAARAGRRHPEWDAERLDRVAAAVERRRGD